MKPDIKAWQQGTGPAPKGMVVYCTGCSLCQKEGHKPMKEFLPGERMPNPYEKSK